MGFQVSLHHRTEYRYDKPVSLGPQTIQLRPTPYCRTPILSYSLGITPADHTLYWLLDPHANHSARVLFSGKTSEFVVDVNLVADLTPINPFAFFLEPGVESFPFQYPAELARDLEPFLWKDAEDVHGPLLQRFVESVRSSGQQGTVNFLVGLNGRVRGEVGYTTRLEHGVQTPEQTLAMRTGSCRDSTWLLVQVCRRLGIAARFVSGYLMAELSEFLGIRTNNYAEYSGLLGVLAWAIEHGHRKLSVVSDSELMVKQIKGQYKVKSPDLKPLYDEARRRIAKLESFTIAHALRHKNKDADRLANDAMDRGMGKTRASSEPRN